MKCSYPGYVVLVYKEGKDVKPSNVKGFKVEDNLVTIIFKNGLRKIIPLNDIKEIVYEGGTIT